MKSAGGISSDTRKYSATGKFVGVRWMLGTLNEELLVAKVTTMLVSAVTTRLVISETVRLFDVLVNWWLKLRTACWLAVAWFGAVVLLLFRARLSVALV